MGGVGGGQWRWGLKGGVALACLTGGGALRRGGGEALRAVGGGDLRGETVTIWHSTTAATSSSTPATRERRGAAAQDGLWCGVRRAPPQTMLPLSGNAPSANMFLLVCMMSEQFKMWRWRNCPAIPPRM